jgi:hypothetical protein
MIYMLGLEYCNSHPVLRTWDDFPGSRDFFSSVSRIPDPTTTNMEEGEQNMFFYTFFVVMDFTKLKHNLFIFEQVQEKKLEPIDKESIFHPKKLLLSSQKYALGSPDARSGIRKKVILDSGSGSWRQKSTGS